MDNTDRKFVEEAEVEGLKAKGHDVLPTKLHVGMEFTLGGVPLRVKKIRNTYMTAVPVAWDKDGD